MAKKRKSRQKGNGEPRQVFQDSDLDWLAEKFQEQVAQDSELTLEEFAIRYGVEPKWIRRRIVLNDQTVSVWHGTTIDRVRVIKREGFRTRKNNSGKIWFTRNFNEARRIAGRRAGTRGKAPAVIGCHINLGKYSEFERPKLDWYVFKHHTISQEVIHKIVNMDRNEDTNRPEKKTKAQEPNDIVDVIVTGASGKLGILCWINEYLELQSMQPIGENHPGVSAIHQWVETQYTADQARPPISEAEMLAQVATCLDMEVSRA